MVSGRRDPVLSWRHVEWTQQSGNGITITAGRRPFDGSQTGRSGYQGRGGTGPRLASPIYAGSIMDYIVRN